MRVALYSDSVEETTQSCLIILSLFGVLLSFLFLFSFLFLSLKQHRISMGIAQSDCVGDMDHEQFMRCNTFPEGMVERESARQGMSKNCIFALDDPEKALVQECLQKGQLSPLENRGLGCMLGMAVGDAVGAPLEFSAVRYGVEDFVPAKAAVELPVKLWTAKGYNTFNLKPGQWTDDCSMGLCVADSLLVHQGKFEPQDLRLRFLNWWSMGYNNAFGWDEECDSKGSVGLGGNISQSMGEFVRSKTPYTLAGDKNTSGNGSIMRNAAIPLCYHSDMAKALDVARKQSKTTHQGDEAAECCAAMTWITVTAMNNPAMGAKELLDRLGREFHSNFYSVQCLVQSRKEERHPSNENQELVNRNWNWRDPDFRYSPARANSQPGYVGSYCMDALAMALHCVWTTDTFVEATLKIINMRGDSDSTGSVCAQIAGSIYGISAIPKCWIEAVQRWDAGGMIALRGWRLMKLLK